jgi:hypothetical protein
MRLERNEEDFHLGYLAHLYVPQTRAYYGGLLVTNTRGVPKEFRHSSAVKPTKAQLALYGDSLEESIGSEAIAPALFNALTAKIDLLLIDNQGRPLYGGYAHQHPPAALLRVVDDPDKAFGESIHPEGELLDARPFTLRGSSIGHLFAYLDDQGNPSAARALVVAQQRMNLLSPFDRIRTVLTEIAQSEHDGRTP